MGLFTRKRNYRLAEKTMSGKTVVLTGFTSGIGYHTALELASRGATMVLIARQAMFGETVKGRIKDLTGNNELYVLQADLASQQQIRILAAEIARRFDKIDVLINNAGAAFTSRSLNSDGIEMTFAVNHMAPYLLTGLLLDLILKSDDPRIITVASKAHKRTTMRFDDITWLNDYKPFMAYAMSKLANVLFTRELDRLIKEQGGQASVNSLHPGVIATNITRDYPQIVSMLWKAFTFGPERGARTTVYLASDPAASAHSGEYFVNCRPAAVAEHAASGADARRLWELSESFYSIEEGRPAVRTSASKKAGGRTKKTPAVKKTTAVKKTSRKKATGKNTK